MSHSESIRPTEDDLRLPKVAVTGAPCSGKSTALAELAESFSGQVAHAEEQARTLFDGVAIPDRLVVPIQRRLAEMIVAEERRAGQAGLPTLCDRTVADGPVFVRWAGDGRDAEALMEYVQPWIPTYDHLLVCSPDGVPYEPDRVRVETEEERGAIHQAFLEAYAAYGIEYELLEGGRQERHDRIAEIVSDLSL